MSEQPVERLESALTRAGQALRDANAHLHDVAAELGSQDATIKRLRKERDEARTSLELAHLEGPL